MMADNGDGLIIAIISSISEIALRASAFLTFVTICGIGGGVAWYFVDQQHGMLQKVTPTEADKEDSLAEDVEDTSAWQKMQIAEQTATSLGIEGSIRSLRAPWIIIKGFFTMDQNKTINSLLAFMQLYVGYYAIVFLVHEAETGFCATRIVVSGMYYDVFTGMQVGLVTLQEDNLWQRKANDIHKKCSGV
jgi:hypothetical protein